LGAVNIADDYNFAMTSYDNQSEKMKIPVDYDRSSSTIEIDLTVTPFLSRNSMNVISSCDTIAKDQSHGSFLV
jgi:hypothetical protein